MLRNVLLSLAILGFIISMCGPARAQSTIYSNVIAPSMPVYNALAYDSALCTTATHNDTTGVQAAINAAETAAVPAIVLIPCAHAWFQSTVTINSSNIHVTGLSGGTQAINATPGTEITWSGACGASSGPLFLFETAGSYSLEGSDLSNVYLDSGANASGGNGCAGFGLILNSVSEGHWSSIGANAFQTVALRCTANASLTNGNSIQNTFINLNANNEINTGIGLQLTATTTSSTFDCNTNTFINTYIGDKNGIGIDVGPLADHNLFINTSVFQFSGGTAVPLLLDCGSRYNIFYYIQGTDVTANGTAQCTGALAASLNNHIDNNDSAGGTNPPVINSGATLIWSDINGDIHGLSTSVLQMGGNSGHASCTISAGSCSVAVSVGAGFTRCSVSYDFSTGGSVSTYYPALDSYSGSTLTLYAATSTGTPVAVMDYVCT